MSTLRVAGRPLIPALQRVWSQVAALLLDEATADTPSLASDQPSIVAALCTCLLGEREGSESAAWPPGTIAELSGPSGRRATTTARGAGVLEQGFDALDKLAQRETGRRFARLDRPAQLRSLFRLEAGRGHLSPRQARAFMDAFLTLAAQAYLRNALELTPPARA